MKLIYCLVYVVQLFSLAYCFNKCYKCDVVENISCYADCTCQTCKVQGQNESNQLYVDCSFKGMENVPNLHAYQNEMSVYNLAGNLIQWLDNDTFTNASELKTLCLGKNELYHSKIDSYAFHGLRNLESLSFQENIQLGQLRKSWFSGLFSLEYLNVKYCGISVIDKNAFQNCRKLRSINLSNNRIKTLHNDIFQHMNLLMDLFLSNNKISSVESFPFNGSHHLKLLILHNNQITTITKSFGLQNMTGLKTINIAFNPYSCDCKLVWFRQWLITTNVTLQNYQETACTSPKLYPLLEFDPDSLDCQPLGRILRIVIPACSAGVFLIIVISIVYYYRWKLRYWQHRRIARKQYQQICEQGPAPINGDDIRYDAYVSYHNEDQGWVYSILQPTLEQQPYNFKLCLDYRDFIAGEKILENIANGVKYSRKMVLVVTNSFARGEWCYFELERARMRMFDNQEDILVVILLEQLLPQNTPVLLQQILSKNTYVEWSMNPDEQRVFWLKLTAALKTPNARQSDEFTGSL
ncbi:toll-like receptor 2 [Anneissia japonica]|uniref:toll-like receptor 2 n=1 Tax=Anneissia japonica TaxID=1529436 RepID=UPI001425A380|nr:toll-like receptor 2 [Anneissia japonica]